MPIYEYQCRSCDHYLEALQKLSDPLLTDCPECGKPALKRLISAPNFRLKGSGWYETDFKSGNRRNIAESGDAADKADKPKDKEPAAKEGAGKDKPDKPDKAGKKTPETKQPAGGGKDGRAKKTPGDDKAA